MDKRKRWETVDGVFGKECPHCKVWKPAEDYHRDAKATSGRCGYCIDCVRERRGIKRRKLGPKGWSGRDGIIGKYCTECLEWKPESEYKRRSAKSKYMHCECSSCRESEAFIEKRRARGRKDYYAKYGWFSSLGWKCEECGEDRYPCLDFHHVDPSTKEYGIGCLLTRWGRDRLLEEVKKCKCLCANCHRMLHFGER